MMMAFLTETTESDSHSPLLPLRTCSRPLYVGVFFACCYLLFLFVSPPPYMQQLLLLKEAYCSFFGVGGGMPSGG